MGPGALRLKERNKDRRLYFFNVFYFFIRPRFHCDYNLNHNARIGIKVHAF